MRRIFKILFAMAGAVCICSCILLFQFYRIYQESAEEYAALAGEAVMLKKPAEEKAEPADQMSAEAPPLLAVDFEALRSVNEEICAWIDFPGQEASYPVVQGADNEYYLNHTFRRTESLCGGIFADCRNEGILTDDNTIIYGHNMRNGSMFGFLKKYLEEAHYQKYPYFDLYLPDTVYRCRILACCRVPADWDYFPISFDDDEGKNAFVERMRAECGYETVDAAVFAGAAVNTAGDTVSGGPLVMLSTCTGRGHTHRLVVLARADMGEDKK